MSTNELKVLQLLGTIGVVTFAFVLFFVRSNLMRLNKYGRDTLAFLGIYLLAVSFWRILAQEEVVNHITVRVINGATGWFFLLILGVKMYLNRRWHKENGDESVS